MNKFKKEKGITLVALIITIVVLLILAAVAIGTAKDSEIIGHAQNAAGSYNQAKVNEIDALAKYENTIEKYVPGEKKEYLPGTDLRINATYYELGKKNATTSLIAYNDGTAVLTVGEETTKFTYSVENGKIKIMEMPEMEITIIKESNNDILTAYDETNAILFSTSTEGFLYLNGREYTTTNQEAYVNKIEIHEDGTYGFYNINGGHIRASVDHIPFLYNGVVYDLKVDTSSTSHDDSPTATSTDNCETINIGDVIYTRSAN